MASERRFSIRLTAAEIGMLRGMLIRSMDTMRVWYPTGECAEQIAKERACYERLRADFDGQIRRLRARAGLPHTEAKADG